MINTPHSTIRMSFEDLAHQITHASFEAPNEIKLELYGLYKVATCSGALPPKPTVFYPRERAKWGAWERAVHACGADPEKAKDRYIELARSLLPHSAV